MPTVTNSVMRFSCSFDFIYWCKFLKVYYFTHYFDYYCYIYFTKVTRVTHLFG